MTTLYQILGHGTWVKLRDTIGAPVSEEIANASGAKEPEPGHPISECLKMTKCKRAEHRKHWVNVPREERLLHRARHPLPRR